MTTSFPQDGFLIVVGAMAELGIRDAEPTVTSGDTASEYDFPVPGWPTEGKRLLVPSNAIVIDMNAIPVRMVTVPGV